MKSVPLHHIISTQEPNNIKSLVVEVSNETYYFSHHHLKYNSRVQFTLTVLLSYLKPRNLRILITIEELMHLYDLRDSIKDLQRVGQRFRDSGSGQTFTDPTHQLGSVILEAETTYCLPRVEPRIVGDEDQVHSRNGFVPSKVDLFSELCF